MKKLAVSLILIILLVSYNIPAYAKTISEADTELRDTLKYALTNSLKEPQEVEATPTNGGNEEIINLLNEIKKELIVSIPKQTGLEKGSIGIIVSTSSSSVKGNIDIDVSIGLPKGTKIDDATIQQIVEDIIKIVSKKENVKISVENIKITTG
ncbi:hypothetical protein KFZ58_16080 [Virgibacillus sp. NKC19-16]|uniref:hypothetical protein n=1 Tax=Virgibacillus salidurans TaxID=2831673 RepID=UPI001F1979DD|nr:hypothetical protein [Virgibacillus sp. NKC19-16]UJL45877.1 hypothetical protein KFZ58_16080 [Virgibacillus sp. NKC19-16]